MNNTDEMVLPPSRFLLTNNYIYIAQPVFEILPNPNFSIFFDNFFSYLSNLTYRLLQAYVACVEQTTPQLRQIRLICKAPLVGLYQGAGFEEVGPSPVVHGKDPWIEMKLGLEESTGRRDEGYSEWT